MLKTFYLLAWILVALLAVVSLLGGYFDAVTQAGFSVAVLALVYALALWSVLTNTQDTRLEISSRGDVLNFDGGTQ
jgi:hypothetical protein